MSIPYFKATKTTKVKGGREQALKDAQEADENKEMVQYWFEDDLGSNNSGYYELQAVLTHKGRSSNSGHYVAWVKYKGDTWIECNDDEVRPVHVEDVMKLSGGGKDLDRARIAIYDCWPAKIFLMDLLFQIYFRFCGNQDS